MKTVDKLKQYKTREHDDFVSNLIHRLEVLEVLIKENRDLKFSNDSFSQENEFLKFIPVSIVSCFEEFFKKVIAEYIDHDDQYLNNVEKLLKKQSSQFSFELIKSLKDKEFTIGEFTAFSLGYSDLNLIRRNLETIISSDLVENLVNISVHELFDKSQIDVDLKLAKESIKEILESLRQVYHVRHIISHEFGAKGAINKKNALNMLSNSILLLKAIDRMMIDHLYEDYAWTQIEMDNRDAKILNEAKQKLEELVESYIRNVRSAEATTNEIISIWKNSVMNEAEFNANQYAEGGSMFNSIYYFNLIASYNKKIAEFEKLLEVYAR